MPFDSAIPKRVKKDTYSRDSCMLAFIAKQCMTAKPWKQPICASPDGWIKKTWYSHTREYELAIEKDKLDLFVRKWMHLENKILNEINQTAKLKWCIASHMRNPE